MFVHLHNHSEYSLLDGLSRIPAMTARAAELGQPALALTDHGALYGAIDFYRACRDAGIKPIIGVEAYVAPKSRRVKDPGDRTPYHMTLLAGSEAGYRNLLSLVSKAHLEGHYYRPRMDREILAAHSEGLFVLSGCISGEVATMITRGQPEQARETVEWYREVFGDRYYLELMWHEHVRGQEEVNRAVSELSRETGVPLVATNDNHYVHPEDAALHDILLCIQTNSTVSDPKRMRMEDETYYLKSESEMAATWAEVPEAVSNTGLIAERCELEIDFTQTRLPRFQTPDGETALTYLTSLCEKGLRQRYPSASDAVWERLRYELDVIARTGFSDYFLVVWDIANFVHRQEIIFGVRGSAASSLVLYCLGVTEIDPLANRLVFERFLNIERREMPDIDMDFQDDRREEVIRYCLDKYGDGHVAQIVTFGTLGARAAVRDVGRALGMDLSDVDHVARLIPSRLHITLQDAIDEVPELSGMASGDGTHRRLLEVARGLEGTVRHASTHAAGLMITEEPLTEYVPLARQSGGDETSVPMTQYPMGPLADLGLLKMDFLGLTNLTTIDRTLRLVSTRHGIKLRTGDIPLEDEAAYRLLASGETFGVFQLESAGMRRCVIDLQPASIADLSALIALYRPGPMEQIGRFVDARHGRVPITYPHDDLIEILEETYGVIVYQDQVLLIAQRFGGYSLGEADILRKAMGKKSPEVMAAEREKFINGGIANGYSPELSRQMFDLIEPFAGYAFNKAHSVCYAMISYWTAYLKANYPVEYMVALLDASTGNPDKLAAANSECRRMGIHILGPDVNRGLAGFAIDEAGDADGIRFGMAAVKNVGAAAVAPVLEARDAEGAFASIEDFCRRVDFRGVNKRALESLIKVGAFDAVSARGPLLEGLDRIVALGQRETQLRESGQSTMFDMFGESVDAPLPELGLSGADDITDHERTLWERELLGVEITQSPFSREMYALQDESIVFAAHLTADLAGQKKSAVGQVRAVRDLTTKKGERFLAVSLGLLDSPIEVVVWPNVLPATEALWEPGRFVSLVGAVRERDGRVSIAVDEAREFHLPGETPPEGPAPAPPDAPPVGVPVAPRPPSVVAESRPLASPPPATNGASSPPSVTDDAPPSGGALLVRLRETGAAADDRLRLEDIVRLLLNYRGDDRLVLEVATDGRVVRLDMPFTVRPCEELTANLAELVGADNVHMSGHAHAGLG